MWKLFLKERGQKKGTRVEVEAGGTAVHLSHHTYARKKKGEETFSMSPTSWVRLGNRIDEMFPEMPLSKQHILSMVFQVWPDDQIK